MPTQPTPVTTAQLTNAGALDLASIAANDLDGAAWLDSAKRPTGGWAIGPDSFPTSGVNGVVLDDTSRSSFDFGTFTISSPGNLTSTFRIHLLIDCTTGGLTFQAAVGSTTVVLATPETGDGEQWYVSDPIGTWAAVADAGLQVRITAAKSSSDDFDMVLKSVCILAETDDTAPDWEKFSVRQIRADSPDDNHYVQVASNQLQHVAGRYPRILATHSFGRPFTDAPSSDALEFVYMVQGSPRTASFRVWLEAFVTPDEGLLTAHIIYDGSEAQSVDITNDSLQWIDAGTFSIGEDGPKELRINTTTDTPTTGPIDVTIRRICIIDEPYLVHDVVPVDPVTPFERTDPVPQTFIRPDVMRMKPGAVILSNYQQRPVTEVFTDRVTAVQNRTFEALHRSHHVVCDEMFGVGGAFPATSASWAAPATLARWQHRNTRSGKGLRAFARIRRVGTSTPYGMRLRIKSGSTYASPEAFIDAGRLQAFTWYELPTMTLPDDGTTLDVELQAGFSDADRNPFSGGSDSIELCGLRFLEAGDTSSRGYLYRVGSLGAVVVDGDTDMVSILVLGSEEFRVRHVRVFIHATGTASGVDFVLENPNGDMVTIVSSPASLPNGWFSDDEIGGTVRDSAPDEPLAGALTDTSVGGWKLHITNNSGADLTLVSWAIELL